MAAIRKFFEKTKLEAKFKLAGEGHKLKDSSGSQKPAAAAQPSAASGSGNRPALNPSAAQQKAAAAALSRLEKRQEPTPSSRSAALIRAQALKELEAERLKLNEATGTKETSAAQTASKEEDVVVPAQLAVTGVYFKCPLIGPEVLPKPDMEARIKEFLYEQLNAEEGGLTACLLIHTANKNREKVQQCVETLLRYFDNIVNNPSEEKYQKIRIQNKVFQEKVSLIEGAEEFLRAAGFELKHLPFSSGKDGEETKDEDFWVLPAGSIDLEILKTLRDALVSAEPIRPELDRGLRVLLPSQATRQTELPPEFFRLSAQELKREQQSRSEQVERSLMLRTKAMRERDEKNQQRKYRFTLIRIKFPNGLILQGVFAVEEDLNAVRHFVEESLEEPMEFDLTAPTGHVLTENSTLLALDLVPAAVLHFKAEVQRESYLKSELVALVQDC